MRFHSTAAAALFSTLAALLLLAGAAHAAPPPHWTGPLRWHLDTNASTRFIYWRQIGQDAAVTTPDDTRQIRFDTYGLHVVTQTAPWKTIDLHGRIPKDAKAVRLSFQTVISRGKSDGNAVLYGFVKAPGSACCVGPPGFRDYPTDYSYPGNIFHEGEILHGVVLDPGGEVRQFTTAEVAVKNRSFMFSWGYRKMADDAVAIGVYLTGYAD